MRSLMTDQLLDQVTAVFLPAVRSLGFAIVYHEESKSFGDALVVAQASEYAYESPRPGSDHCLRGINPRDRDKWKKDIARHLEELQKRIDQIKGDRNKQPFQD